MNREQYLKIKDLHAQGWTFKEIAEETGFHPATVSARLQADGPHRHGRVSPSPVLDERWRARIAELIETYPRPLGVSVHNKRRAEGFAGGYSTVLRALRDVRGPRFRPGEAGIGPDRDGLGRGGPVPFDRRPSSLRFAPAHLGQLALTLGGSRHNRP